MLLTDRNLFSLLARLTPALLLLGLIWTETNPAHAQHPTEVTSILNGESAPDTTLETNHNGSLLAPGTFINDGTENDSIPAAGGGTRLMWYPAKAAFRAGRVFYNTSAFGIDGSSFWDASNVGKYSIAFGKNTKASGSSATAMGLQTTASSNAATAMGYGTTASSSRATAMGFQTTASGDDATAMGNGTTASSSRATAMGNGTTASGSEATAMGSRTTASSSAATAMGRLSTASGSYATAMGDSTLASGGAATTMGDHTAAATDSSLSIGYCNDANTSADGTLFVAGNGRSPAAGCDTRSDAMVLDQSGNLTTAGTVNGSSDRRLKKKIQPLGDDILKRLADLRPVRYEFKNQETHPSGEQIGLVAQDVQKEFPQFVTKGSDGYLSLAYPRLTAVLVKGFQEQQTIIEKQRSHIQSMKAENEAIRERLAALEAKVSTDDPALASLAGPWSLALLLGLGLGGIGAGVFYRRRE